ncbi:GntR family transcriptional regulator [Citreicella sp. C3M06]|uniref:GntR family transcriptional regulator n=1 Tax=Citreicella sp. C3M06 TaxID=2841564 RepID=UPI001C08FC46|nr:GntR family transcriptional regulator [Citreicella sp. C3M06]MBU2960073.1 GntR family transcriptional regulator [Citreicella sp. C3M06]
MAESPIRTEGVTLAERAEQMLQQDIISGAHEPGARLAVTELANRYGVSSSPIREALSRLAARNMVAAVGRRGFRVQALSYEDLADITRVRVMVEREALLLSMRCGGDVWEADVIGALHRLRLNVQRAGAQFGQGGEEFDRLHHGFHAALISGCGSVRLIDMADDLYNQAFRYRQINMQGMADAESFIGMHEVLAKAATGRDEDRAFALLRAHLNSTLMNVYPEGSPQA